MTMSARHFPACALTLTLALAPVGCGSAPRATAPAAEPEVRESAAVAEPAVVDEAAGAPPSESARGPTDRIAPAPIPEGERLDACGVELAVTSYDEETRAPTTQRRAVRTLARIWSDALREREWADVAPIPLTLAQARASLPGVSEHDESGQPFLLAQVGDGTVAYRFDGEGRTRRVDWDPVADSRDYVYTYSYRCRPPIARPRWADDE